MAFRWKTTPADQQAYLSQEASRQMAGYTPTYTGMQGYRPNVAPSTPFNNEELAQQNYDQFNNSLQAKRQQLEQLKAQLAEIDKQIAAVEAGGADEEKAIAAKLAEIGDISLYQGIINREQNSASQQKANASSIDNMLFEADKLSWGLNSKSDEERGIVKQNIRAVLDRAKQVADQTGTPLPQKYRELEQKLQASEQASSAYESERRRANELYILYRNGGLEDSHIKEMEDYIKTNPNSEIATQYRQLIEQYKGKTKQSKAAASKRKADAKAIVDILRDLSLDEQLRRWSKMSPSEQKLVNDQGYIMDPKLGITSKGGI